MTALLQEALVFAEVDLSANSGPGSALSYLKGDV